jgi:cell division protein ZapA
VSQVNVTINGRQFRMACEDGQEAHLQQLAKDLDDRIVALRGQFGEIGDARLTVMAALLVADDLAETGKKLWRPSASRIWPRSSARVALRQAAAWRRADLRHFTA